MSVVFLSYNPLPTCFSLNPKRLWGTPACRQATMWKVYSILGALLFTRSWASPFVLPQSGSPAVVQLNILRNDIPDPITRDQTRRKRDKTVLQLIDNEVRWLIDSLCISRTYYSAGDALLLQCNNRHTRAKPTVDSRYW